MGGFTAEVLSLLNELRKEVHMYKNPPEYPEDPFDALADEGFVPARR
jgi:hypothetical protein